MKLRPFVELGLAGLIVIESGCCLFRSSDPQPGWSSQPVYPGSPGAPGANPETLMPRSLPPTNPAPMLPPPGASGYGTPSAMWVAPPHAHPGVPPSLLPPTRVPVDARYYSPVPQPVVPRFQTAEPPLAPTRPMPPPQAKPNEQPGARLLPPDLLEPNPTAKPVAPKVPAEPAASPSLPVGIPFYAVVKSDVATGRKPDPEGLDWLKANGYRAVLHLRKPGTPNTADQEQVEKRGLKYLTQEVSPDSLTLALVEQFNKIVADSSDRPLFVYDKDGSVAGALWYLHFRSADRMPAETARVRAETLGLKSADSDEQKALWIAIQKIVLP